MVKPIILVDLDIVLDVLQKREPFYEMSARVLACVEHGQVHGWIAAHSLTTLFYLSSRYRSGEYARMIIAELLRLPSVVPVNQKVIECAWASPYRDFEDAVQMMAAVQIGANYLITRKVRDFEPGPLPVLQPAEFLTLID